MYALTLTKGGTSRRPLICGQMHREKSELRTLEIPSGWWPAPDPPGGPDRAAKVINNLKIYVSKKC